MFLSERNGAGRFGHGGVDAGFNASALSSLGAIHGVVMLANSANGMRRFRETERTLFAAMGWAGADVPVVRATLSAVERDAWVGDFTLEHDVPFLHAQARRNRSDLA